MCDFGGDFGGVSGDGYSTPYNVLGMGDVRFPAVGGALGSGDKMSVGFGGKKNGKGGSNGKNGQKPYTKKGANGFDGGNVGNDGFGSHKQSGGSNFGMNPLPLIVPYKK